MFGSILILICSLMHVYVLWRISNVPFVKRYLHFKYLVLVILILWAILFSGLFFGHNRSGAFASILETIAMTWMAMLFLIFTTVLMADVLTGFGFFLPRRAASIRGWGLIAGVVLSATALIQGYRAPVVDKYEVYLDCLPGELNNLKVIGLSDLHVGSQINDKWLASRVTEVNELKPDLIVLLGDIVEGHTKEKEEIYAATLARLSAPLGKWAVLGNHENFRDEGGNSTSLYDKAGIPVLRGNWTELKPGLVLAGVDPPLGRMGNRDVIPGSISSILAGRPRGATILLSHFPQGADEAAKAGVGLMLSGHTHGGQIWPFSWIVKLTYPLLQGEYRGDGMTVIVSRGAGTWGPRMRLWRPGEIVFVTLHSKDGNDK
jgi:uncharacterized protein